MYFLVYLSTATALFSEDALEDILQTSRRNNATNNITGLLLYHDGAILQVLEGEQAAVENLFQRLLLDNRHHSVLKMMDGYTGERYFVEWSMGFRRLSGREWREVAGYLPVGAVGLSTRDVTGPQQQMITVIRSYSLANFR